MSIYNAMFIQSNDHKFILENLSNWLDSHHSKMDLKVTSGSFPFELYSNDLILNESLPTILVMSTSTPNWSTIHYNSLNKMGGIAQELSLTLSCQSIVILAESVTESYYLDYYRNGENQCILLLSGKTTKYI